MKKLNYLFGICFLVRDGPTSNLTLKLTHGDGGTIKKSSWLQFDSKLQTLFVVPVLKRLPRTKIGFVFRLEASNSLHSASGTYIYINITGMIC